MESHIKNRVFLPLTPINPYFHPMTGLLELLVGLLAAWRGFGQWNGQWNPIVRTTGASGPLGCMERVWAPRGPPEAPVVLSWDGNRG